MKPLIQHLHLIGIGGAGMSGIAAILLRLGYRITGSDLALNQDTEYLRQQGATIYDHHAEQNILGADAVVISTAIAHGNPEVLAAQKQGIPVVHRALILAELLRRQKGIAISGTHGKTTTTSLITSVLLAAQFDPSFAIGGCLREAGANGYLGNGEFIVVEADESDASFLYLSAVIAVATNIDLDHMDTYGQSLQKLQDAFVNFLQDLPFYGTAILCIDDTNLQAILPRLAHRKVITYGFSKAADIRALDVQVVDQQMHFVIAVRDQRIPMQLNLVGKHHVLNALAAFSVARFLGIATPVIATSFAKFQGVGRRFERYGPIPLPDGGEYMLIDDYGHHPLEVSLTLQATRLAFPGRRIILAFQPHRYTRTRDCFPEFLAVLATAEILLLTSVYPASEAHIPGADSEALLAALHTRSANTLYFEPHVEQLPLLLAKVLRADDVLLVMGAGSIYALPQQMLAHAQQIAMMI